VRMGGLSESGYPGFKDEHWDFIINYVLYFIQVAT
jgi:hypothetical protein